MVISTVDVTSNEKYFGGNIFCRVYVLPVVKKFEIITKIKNPKNYKWKPATIFTSCSSALLKLIETAMCNF